MTAQPQLLFEIEPEIEPDLKKFFIPDEIYPNSFEDDPHFCAHCSKPIKPPKNEMIVCPSCNHKNYPCELCDMKSQPQCTWNCETLSCHKFRTSHNPIVQITPRYLVPANLEFEYNQLLAHMENLTVCLCPRCSETNQKIEQAIYTFPPKSA